MPTRPAARRGRARASTPPTSPVASKEVRRLLIRGEELVAVVPWHPVWLLRSTLASVAVLALLTWVGTRLPDHSVLGPALPWLVAALVCFWGGKYLAWRTERLVVTDRRLLMVSGLLSRRVAVMPLRKVTDLTFEQPLVGRAFDALGWGTFVFESAGQDQAFRRIPYVLHPDALYHQLSEEIFGERGIYARKKPTLTDGED